jgi:long-chain acyl-CoA synthetase
MAYNYEKPDNLVDLFETAVVKFGSRPFLGTKDSQGVYQWLTYQELANKVDLCRSGLSQRGIGIGDTVGFIGGNRWEWAVSAFATYGLGARFVPMYESEKAHIREYIIKHSECKMCIVSKPEVAHEIQKTCADSAFLKTVVVIDTDAESTSFATVLKSGINKPVASNKPLFSDIAALIYTSGTTGDPKGVLLSHGNFTHDARAGYTFYKTVLNETSVSLSVLPWAHSYGMVAELYNWLLTGGSIGFMEKVETLADDMFKLRPTFLLAVPRVFNKIYAALHKKMKDTGGIKEKLFNWGVAAAKTKRLLANQGKSSVAVNIKVAIADTLVFSKIRQRFGGRLGGALTASAMMNVEISYFFWDIGIPVYDAYGLTETSPALAMNRKEDFRIGSVGKTLNAVRIEIDKSAVGDNSADGEIVAYGPMVMQGYYKNPEATAAVMTADGGFRTGDRGRFDADGFLYITGRLKEQYKLENGKYVFPAAIEEEMKLLPYVENAMVWGEAMDYNVAIIVPDFAVLAQWAEAAKLKTPMDGIIHNHATQDFIANEIIQHLRENFGGYEVPKKYLFVDEAFTIENGLLTQTQKLKRRDVFEKYQAQLKALYQ